MRLKVLLFTLLMTLLAGLSVAQDATGTPEAESTPAATEQATEQTAVTPGGEVVSPIEVTVEQFPEAIPPEIAGHAEQ